MWISSSSSVGVRSRTTCRTAPHSFGFGAAASQSKTVEWIGAFWAAMTAAPNATPTSATVRRRSEEHTSELQSRFDLVCRLLLEKKKKYTTQAPPQGRRYVTEIA